MLNQIEATGYLANTWYAKYKALNQYADDKNAYLLKNWFPGQSPITDTIFLESENSFALDQNRPMLFSSEYTAHSLFLKSHKNLV